MSKNAVFGLGVEGKDLVKYLQKQEGTEIHVFDRKEKELLDLTGLKTDRLIFHTGENYLNHGFKKFDVVYRSPGIYRYSKELIEADKDSVKISSAIKLFFENCPAKIVGVTGTKGKGTTSTLIYEILKKAKYDVYLAGNIGISPLELLPKLTRKSWVILELSSFQLIDLDISPHIAVVLNVTVDHLDWHKNRKEYVDAKRNIVKHQTKDDFAVINFDYNTPKSFSKNTKAKISYFSRYKKVNGAYVKANTIYLKDEEIGGINKLLLRGEHNWENVTAAIMASSCAGVSNEVIKKTIFNFKGLEHRLELVGTKNGITFYNDSFSTNPQPTMAAVESFTEDVTLIMGGSDKGLNYDELGQFLSKKENVKAVILIGQIADQIQESLVKAKYKNKIINLGMTTMKDIVEVAVKNSKKDGVILLSPATASFGMFIDYKDRGYQFKDKVRKL